MPVGSADVVTLGRRLPGQLIDPWVTTGGSLQKSLTVPMRKGAD